MNMTKADMVKFLGSQSRVSEVLNRKRSLTLKMVKSLYSGLKIPAEIPFRRLLGPVENFKGTFREVNLRSRQILAVVPQLERDVDFYQRVPSVINIGNVNIPPESFLAGIAEIVKYIAVHNKLPGEIALKKLLKYPEISLQPYFQEKTFVHNDLYPEGFTGEKICRYSMMQSWSYKPAVKKS